MYIRAYSLYIYNSGNKDNTSVQHIGFLNNRLLIITDFNNFANQG